MILLKMLVVSENKSDGDDDSQKKGTTTIRNSGSGTKDGTNESFTHLSLSTHLCKVSGGLTYCSFLNLYESFASPLYMLTPNAEERHYHFNSARRKPSLRSEFWFGWISNTTNVFCFR
jgi:hypothetical protein